MKSVYESDILIVGGGIIGTVLARTLSSMYATLQINLIEKEKSLGEHSSTRNSSVLHSGIYYLKDSYKAKFCKEGNEILTKYIEENKIPIRYTGKFVIASNDEEYTRLEALKTQAVMNHVEHEWLDSDQAEKKEPHLKILKRKQKILYTPSTKVSNNILVIKQIEEDLKQVKKISLFKETKFIKKINENEILCSQKGQQNVNFRYKYLINCAGLYSDKIAKEFGFCQKYVILPFKGRYLVCQNQFPEMKSLIYPTPPQKGNYFLGVHITCTTDFQIKLGPNAIPAFWREQYEPNFKNFQFSEFSEIIYQNMLNLFSQKSGFYLKHMKEEAKKLYRSYTFNESKKLTTLFDNQTPKLSSYKDFKYGKAGIRAQLIDIQSRELVNDFIIENDKNSMHLLNVVSPGWTCAFPISYYVANKLKNLQIFSI